MRIKLIQSRQKNPWLFYYCLRVFLFLFFLLFLLNLFLILLLFFLFSIVFVLLHVQNKMEWFHVCVLLELLLLDWLTIKDIIFEGVYICRWEFATVGSVFLCSILGGWWEEHLFFWSVVGYGQRNIAVEFILNGSVSLLLCGDNAAFHLLFYWVC